MCVIAICHAKRIGWEEFEESFRVNDDGVGFSWFENGTQHFKKGFMNVQEAWNAYNQFIPQDCFPHVVHFRAGTPTKEDITHPFIISEDSPNVLEHSGNEALLFHNGSVSGWEALSINVFMNIGKIPDGRFSDTRVIAIMLSRLGKPLFELLNGKWIWYENGQVEKFGKWDNEEDGISWSNGSYRVVHKKGKSSSSKTNYYISGSSREETNKIKDLFDSSRESDFSTKIEFGNLGIITKLEKCLEIYI